MKYIRALYIREFKVFLAGLGYYENPEPIMTFFAAPWEAKDVMIDLGFEHIHNRYFKNKAGTTMYLC